MIKNPGIAQHFDDLDLSSFGYGGLNGTGAEGHTRATAKPMPDGVKISLNCDNCGVPNILTIDWTEIVVISTGHLPSGWKIDQGHFRPEVGCASCRKLVTPGVTADEAGRWLRAGVNARFVDPAKANAIAQQVARGGMR